MSAMMMMRAGPCVSGKGFTLLELLISMSILVVITAIVYASFSGVTRTIDMTRTVTEEVRLRQFLGQSLRTNIATAYVDLSYTAEAFQFLGVNEDGIDGAKDSLRFISTASLIGGLTLPGDLKEVRYEVLEPRDSAMELSWDDDGDDETADALTGLAAELRGRHARLRVTETPLLAGNVQSLDEETGYFTPAEGYESPQWDVPIRSFDVRYFDGEQWVDEWDSLGVGRLPWALRVRVNFARTEAYLEQERDKNYDEVEDPEFEMVVTLPAGVGVFEDQRQLPVGQGVGTGGIGAPGADGGDGAEGAEGAQGRPNGQTGAPFQTFTFDIPTGAGGQ